LSRSVRIARDITVWCGRYDPGAVKGLKRQGQTARSTDADLAALHRFFTLNATAKW